MSHLLLKAVDRNDVSKVLQFLDEGADIEYFSKSGPGRTALNEAALCGQLEMVKALMERGANLNTQDNAMGYTPIAWACEEGHLEIAETLIAAGADINAASKKYKRTPLIAAAANGHLDIVKLLIKSGANVDLQTISEQNALTEARKNGHESVVKYLSKCGTSEPTKKVHQYLDWPDVSVTLSEEDYASPEKVLRAFILSMHQWETDAYAKFGGEDTDVDFEEVRKLEQAAFEPYCTEKERKYGRCGSFGNIPEYHPDESLVSVTQKTKSRVEIVTRQGKSQISKYECLYVLLKKAGQFLIDSKKTRVAGSEKWERTIL
jgi:hypothetical protein